MLKRYGIWGLLLSSFERDTVKVVAKNHKTSQRKDTKYVHLPILLSDNVPPIPLPPSPCALLYFVYITERNAVGDVERDMTGVLPSAQNSDILGYSGVKDAFNLIDPAGENEGDTGEGLGDGIAGGGGGNEIDRSVVSR